MPLYEHTAIARPDLSATQAQSLADEFTKLIEEQGGSVAKFEYWGLRNLAYRMKKSRKGHYLHFNIDGPAALILELERNQRIHEDVLRYLSVRVDAFEEAPSVIMQARQTRDDRGRGDRRDDRPRRNYDDRPRPPRDDNPRDAE